MAPTIMSGYSRANTNNLPFVDIFMMAEYFNSSILVTPEASHNKTNRSADPNYGEKAIGYVQVKREESLVRIQCLFRPQTRVKDEDYVVRATVRDVDTPQDRKAILEVECKCSASKAMCKHIVAFVAWMNRRTVEEAPTSVECYWKKSSLASIGSTHTHVLASKLGTVRKTTSNDIIPSKELLTQVLAKCKELNLKNCILYNQTVPQISNLSMHFLLFDFYEVCKIPTFNKFIRFLKQKLNEADLDAAAAETKEQSQSTLWKELRYGRITASKLYEVSKCATVDGCLVKMILGAKKVVDTKYMKRGRELEGPVLKVVEKTLKVKINKTGLVLNAAYPIFGSSPDGITDKYAFEVKCPGNAETFLNYIDINNEPAEKYMMQLQLQMLMSDKQEGFFCVARPDFERSKQVVIKKVERDDQRIHLCMHSALRFWEANIYPKLMKSVCV